MHMTTNFSLRNASLAKLMVIILYNDSFKQKRGDLSPELEECLGKTVCVKEEKEEVADVQGRVRLNRVKPPMLAICNTEANSVPSS